MGMGSILRTRAVWLLAAVLAAAGCTPDEVVAPAQVGLDGGDAAGLDTVLDGGVGDGAPVDDLAGPDAAGDLGEDLPPVADADAGDDAAPTPDADAGEDLPPTADGDTAGDGADDAADVGDTDDTDGTDDTAAPGDADAGEELPPAEDADTAEELPPAEDADAEDTAAPDTADPGDAADGDAPPTCPGAAGCPCTQHAECGPALACLAGVTGKACVDPCTQAPPLAETCNGADDDCDGQTDEATCADGNPCTDDVCSGEAGCTFAANTAACDDGQACTVADACAAGACQGQAKVCNDANGCTADSCDAAAGKCAFAPMTAPCDDGNACTTGDVCQAATCQGLAKACDDGNACTQDGCDAATGACTAQTTAQCDDGNPCTDDACDAKSGACSHGANAAICDDGAPCTAPDLCAGGKCAGTPTVCDDGNVCTDDGCDGKTGVCTFTANKVACNDGNACTGNDACAGGKCGGAAKSCSDGVACTVDQCNPATGACSSQADAALCDDGDVCTTDACDLQAGCSHAAIAQCGATVKLPYQHGFDCGSVLNGFWATSAADAGPIWAFDATPDPPGFLSPSCSLNFNNGKNFELSGKTVQGTATSPWFDTTGLGAGVPVKVKFHLAGSWEAGAFDNLDLEASTDGASWKVLATYDPPAAPWTAITADLSAYGGQKFKLRFRFSTLDAIQNGGSGAFVDDLHVFDQSCKLDADCDDGEACTADSCDGAKGLCVFAPLPDGGKCGDGNPCKLEPACVKGVCQGQAKVCSDGNECTLDACDAKQGCVFSAKPDGSFCSDGNACTSSDACMAGKCAAVAKCDDGNPCTKDECTGTTGKCAHTPLLDGSACSDGDVCTGPDACKSGVCGGAPSVCSELVGSDLPCGDAGAWLFEPKPAADKPAWNVDATPNPPGFKSPGCALNFNDGTNFQCPAGADRVKGTATWSQVVDLGGAEQATLVFASWHDTDTFGPFDQRWVEASADGFQTVPVSVQLTGTFQDTKKWLVKKVDLTPLAGKKASLRLRFDSVNCQNNFGAGWFVDDLQVMTDQPDGCKTASECDDGNGCTTDVCDPAKGACVHTPAVNGAACDNGDVCTAEAKCQAGACVATKAKVCNDSEFCTTDTCVAGKGCAFAPRPDGTTCSDGDNCTTSDTCTAGKCGGKAKCDDGNPCTLDACSAFGQCSATATGNGLPCSDGDACTTGDVCKQGLCEGTPAPCSTALVDAMDCGSGGKWQLSAPTGKVGWAVDASPNPPGYQSPSCSLNFNDGTTVACPSGSSKVAGTATQAAAVDLTAAKQATLTFWSWSDGFGAFPAAQRVVEASADGFQTVLVSKVVTVDFSSNKKWLPVQVDLTPAAGKSVQLRFRYDSVGCPSFNVGTGWFVDDLSIVTDGVKGCQSHADCDDGNDCTIELCDAKTGSCKVGTLGDGTGCDDGKPCSVNDVCLAGTCTGKAKTCQDNEPCTQDSCNPLSGQCQFAPLADGSGCFDGETCTSNDACAAGKCQGKPLPDGQLCNDGNACTLNDKCATGKCAGTPQAGCK